MRLTNEQIKRITFGWVEAEENDGVLRFYKNTAAQRAAWIDDGNEFVYDTACATTGIKLDFYTNSDYFKLETATKSPNGEHFEVCVNGLYVETATDDDGYFLALGGGEKRVTVYLGSHRSTEIKSVEVGDGATVTPATYSTKILFTGDSITQGYNSKRDCNSYANIVARAFDAEAVINGCGGGYFLPSHFEKTSFDPDVVIIAYGVNDYYRCGDYETVERNATEFLLKVRAAYEGKKLFVITPIWCWLNENAAIGDFTEYCKKLAALAEANGFTAIDGLKLVPHDRDFYAGDDLHPNELGFFAYAENLARELKRFV